MRLYYKILTCVIFSLICITDSLYADTRRHIVILYDNSGSYHRPQYIQEISEINSKLISLFDGNRINEDLSLLNREIDENILFFNPDVDDVSFYWFVADQNNNIKYREEGESYKDFEKYFIKHNENYRFSNSINGGIEEFISYNLSKRPQLEVGDYSYQWPFIETYSFTAFAYPLCLDCLLSDYSSEYVFIVVSDFMAGSTFGNRQDESLLKGAFGNKSKTIIDRANFLNSQFFKIDYFDYYTRVKQNNTLLGFTAFKVRPMLGSPVPENLDIRLNSNINFAQTSFLSDIYDMDAIDVVFSHNERTLIENVLLRFNMNNGQTQSYDITDKVHYNSKQSIYHINDLNGIRLPGYNSDEQKFDGEISVVFQVNYETSDDSKLKYSYEVKRQISTANFIFKTQLSPMEISALVTALVLMVLVLLALFFIKKGKPIGILLHFNRFNNTYEDTDFSSSGKGKLHTDYREWTNQDIDNQRFVIKIEGRFNYQQLNRWYNWKENTGYNIRVFPTSLNCPEGFDAYISCGLKASNNATVPIELENAFEDSKFSFSVIFVKVDDKPIVEPQYFSFRLDLYSMNSGFLKRFEVHEQISYDFHIGPDLGDVWVGIDPGTTGSCIAVATDSSDLTIEKDDDEKDKIYPSELLIISKDMKSSSPDEVRKNTRFGFKSQAVANEDPSKGMYKFVSIKKLLGYNTDFSLGHSKAGQELSVNSNLLSTLLIECLMRQQKDYLEAEPQEYSRFLTDGSFLPQRAVIAIPNNFTASKIQQLKDCFFNVKNQSVRELRFIYEAEAILVNYINTKNSNTGKMESSTGENVFIYDMGGATINVTIANVKRFTNKNETKYRINIIAKLGYGVGGDTIDYAYLQWIFSKKDEYSILSQNNPFGSNADVSMAFRRQLKKSVLVLKKETINYYNSSTSSSLIDRGSIERFNDFGLKYIPEDDPFESEIKKGNNSFLFQKEFKDYVWNNIETIVGDVTSICRNKGINSLDTVILSGRSSHFPRVKEYVESGITKSDYKPRFILLSLEESKSAVAKGACYYGIQNRMISLQNRTTNGVFGVIQHTQINEPAIFHQLIDQGQPFNSDGEISSSTRIHQQQSFDLDGKKVQFCQVMGVDPDKIIANEEKHKYATIATLYAKPFAIQSVQMTVDNKDKIICSVTDVNGDVQPYIQSVVNDADIMTSNDEQYTFFVKQS